MDVIISCAPSHNSQYMHTINRIDVAMPSSPSSTAPIQQQSHVVQAIVDSVTRCFHPIQVYPCSDISSNPTNAHQTGSPPMTNADADDNARNHSTSSPSSSPKTKQYDADRYIHRKLEIFRTTDEDCIAAFGIPRPRPSSSMRHAHRLSTSQTKVQSRGGGGGGGGGNRKSNTLVSSSDEEISNLAKNQKKFDEDGYDHKKDQSSGTLIASLFRIVQDPLSCIANANKHYNYSGGGLCFASPVRMPEAENVSELSDWRLTANEFVSKYQGGRAIDGCGKNNAIANTAADDIPDVVASSASEEATMTSASYFDQKYSHIIEKNPPVPLFREYLVDVSENNTKGVMKIFELRKAGAGGSPTRGGVGSWRRNNESPQSSKSSQTPIHIKVKKKSPKISNTNQAKTITYDSAPIGKSSSVSTQSADEEKTSSPSTSTRSLWQRMCNNIVPDQQQHQPESQKNYREPEFVVSL